MSPVGWTVVFLAILFLAGCNETVLRSTIARTPVVINGNLDDWDSTQFTILKEKKSSIAITNDSQFLYIAGRCSDPMRIRAIEHEGLTLWIDPSCNQHTNIEIHYPASRYASLDQSRGGFWDALSADQQARALATLKELQAGILIIAKEMNSTQIIPHDSTGYFSAALDISKNALTFEFRIPLTLEKLFPGNKSLLQQEKVGIGFGRSKSPIGEFTEGMDRRNKSSDGAMGTVQQGFLPVRDAGVQDTDVWFEVLIAKERGL